MNIKFNNLWKQLEMKKISEKEFQSICGLNAQELAMIKSDHEDIDFKLLNKICHSLNCDISDIISYKE